MKRRLFWLLFVGILLFAFLQRAIPPLDGNFYFTMDQGNDAVHAREIFSRHKILYRGPETGITGVYHGVLWYYFLAFGYAIFNWHPYGGLFMIIVLNVCLIGLLMSWLHKKVSSKLAILVGSSLLWFWPFYETSRYAFNPFPTVALSFFLILSLILFLKDHQKRHYVLAAIPVGLMFNAESAYAIPATVLFLAIGVWSLLRKYLVIKLFIFALVCMSVFFVPRIISEFKRDFAQSQALSKELHDPEGIFSETRYQKMTNVYFHLIGEGTISQIPLVGFVFFILVLGIFFKGGYSAKNLWRRKFVLLSLLFVGITYLWFGSNKGWKEWHTVAIPVLIYVATLFMISTFRRNLAVVLTFVMMFSQVPLFVDRYREYWHPSSDPSILANELGAVDWVYNKAGGRGFYEYNYLPSVLDYPYQYLFWWRGIKKYGYVPCEYSSYPGSPKLFVRGAKHYTDPQNECSELRFLIVEPDKNDFLRSKWLEGVREGTELIEEKEIGQIHLEMRKNAVKDFFPKQ